MFAFILLTKHLCHCSGPMTWALTYIPEDQSLPVTWFHISVLGSFCCTQNLYLVQSVKLKMCLQQKMEYRLFSYILYTFSYQQFWDVLSVCLLLTLLFATLLLCPTLPGDISVDRLGPWTCNPVCPWKGMMFYKFVLFLIFFLKKAVLLKLSISSIYTVFFNCSVHYISLETINCINVISLTFCVPFSLSISRC